MELVQRLLSAAFPSRCILCQQTIAVHALNQNVEVCTSCYLAMPHNEHCCTLCALPLPADILRDASSKTDVLCGRCLTKRPQFDYSYSLFCYQGEVIKLVQRLKFNEKIGYARTIGELLLTKLQDELLPEQGRPECIIPVPLHHSRLRKRGYNQSTEISRVLTSKAGLTIKHGVVIRQRHTAMQTGLKAKQRQQNIKGAFKVVTALKVNHVLIIDDVITTGATVNELAKVLRSSGIKRIGVLSIARAPLNLKKSVGPTADA